jgi:putative phosphotransacetylase
VVTPAFDRQAVEAVVREVVGRRLASARTGTRLPAAPRAGRVPVNVSARHMHVSQADLERLFGPGASLTVARPLYQPGQFAAGQTVTLVGPRGRVIPNLRILGPVRKQSQVELAFTDGVWLGIDLPLRLSGDVAGSPGAAIVGPRGAISLEQGVIRAARHVHMSPADAARYGVADGDVMRLRAGGDAAVSLERVRVRVDPAALLEVHIDTDEANACGLHQTGDVELVK